MPQFPGKYSTPNTTGKIVGIQNPIAGLNTAGHYNSGITHIWAPEFGPFGAPLIRAGMFASEPFNSSTPSNAQIDAYAYSSEMEAGSMSTDEFFEGTYPIVSDFYGVSNRFYQKRKERAASLGINIHDFGSYGYTDCTQHRGFELNPTGRDINPMSSYMLSLLGPDPASVMNSGGLKAYLSGSSAIRGGVVGLYYSWEVQEILLEMTCWLFAHAMQVYADGDHELLGFFWNHMQDNRYHLDNWQNATDYVKPDSGIIDDFPVMPFGLMDIFVSISLLIHKGVYMWGDKGAITMNEDSGSSTYDAFIIAAQNYIRVHPYLASVGHLLYCCDYKSNGVWFNSATTERRISMQGSPYYHNRYFNEVAAQKKAFVICCPSNPEVWFHCDMSRGPHTFEQVLGKKPTTGVEYDLGMLPGSRWNIICNDF